MVTGKEDNSTRVTGYIHETISKDDSAKSRKVRVYSMAPRSGKFMTKNISESEDHIKSGKDNVVITTEYQVDYEESQDSLSEKGFGSAESWKDGPLDADRRSL